MPTFERQSLCGTDRIGFEAGDLVMAGWTGRDPAAVAHHVAELAALGVSGPSRVPLFYRLDPALMAGPVAALPPGTVMFPGAIAALGGIRPSPRFEMTLEDPVLGRSLHHGYDVRALPI